MSELSRSRQSAFVVGAGSPSILGNVGTLISFRIGAKDAPIISKQLGWYKSKPVLINSAYLTDLPNYGNYVRLMINHKINAVFSSTT